MMDAVKNVVKDLESKRTLASDYPRAERIEKGLIPVYDANNVSGCASSTFRKLLLEELDINAAAADRVADEEELRFLASLLDQNRPSEADEDSAKAFLAKYVQIIDEIVHCLSMEGPGVCIIENLFSEQFMTELQRWVDDYLERDTSCRE